MTTLKLPSGEGRAAQFIQSLRIRTRYEDLFDQERARFILWAGLFGSIGMLFGALLRVGGVGQDQVFFAIDIFNTVIFIVAIGMIYLRRLRTARANRAQANFQYMNQTNI